METLALFGGKPIREEAIPWVNTMDDREKNAVIEVMDSGVLSAFIGRKGEGFLGGGKVRELEEVWCRHFSIKHAISVNSATTALHVAIAACEIGPGDEVLVTPYTMVATASAILMNGAIPIFVDIHPDTYTLNPSEIKRWITHRTKGIVVTNLFGLPAQYEEICQLAKEHNLAVIEDNAQAPGASPSLLDVATDIVALSVYSLNYHKVIHSGEGGMIGTNCEDLARRCQLLRNHGEVVVDDEGDEKTIVLGSNYRMSELHAAIGIEQVKKLEDFLVERRELAAYVTEKLGAYSGLKGVTIPKGYTHSYYLYPIQYREEEWGFSRTLFAKLMKSEGFPLGEGYQKPLYLLPIYQHKRVYNETTYPFSLIQPPTQDYEKGLCPITESYFEKRLLVADICRKPFTKKDIDDFFCAIDKIWKLRKQVTLYEKDCTSSS